MEHCWKGAQMHIKIIDLSHCETTREADPLNEWDGDDIYTSHNIQGFTVLDSYHDLPVSFSIEDKRKYYLLYVLYSTGDSFHHEEGCIEYISLYQTLEEAE